MSRNLNDLFCYKSSSQIDSQLDMAMESILDGDSSDAFYHLSQLLYDEISTLPMIPQQRVSLFRFTRLPVLNNGSKPIIEDIRHQAITFSNPKYFNDPMDPILREWLSQKKKEKLPKPIRQIFAQLMKSLDNLRICCLSSNDSIGHSEPMYLNPLMWAHYAGMHKGVCIEYEITNDMINAHNDSHQVLRMANVRYRNNKVMNDFITLDNALLAKGSSWNYENETRLINYSMDSVSRTREIGSYKTMMGFEINSVYLGYRIMENDRKDIQKAIKGKRIKLYQVRFDDNNITKLIADRID